MCGVNIFAIYEKREDDYTNGLLSLLSLASAGRSQLLNRLLNQLDLSIACEPSDFRVQVEHADAEVSGRGFCIRFESKIVSATLREEQIRQHLGMLDKKPQADKYLVLLTPDDSNSGYIRPFLGVDRRIRHVDWRHVYDLLEPPDGQDQDIVFTTLCRQFQRHIWRTIFDQDIAGCILKIRFGEESGVDPNTYLREMKEGRWDRWNTPRQYKSLDGTGRKLMLYDRIRQGVTIEFEIGEVEKTDEEAGYPWRNAIVSGSIRTFDPPLPLERIRSLQHFQDFGLHRKDRNAFRNLTREQYRLLVEDRRNDASQPLCPGNGS